MSDCVEVIRCRDCKYWDDENGLSTIKGEWGICDFWSYRSHWAHDLNTDAERYCAYAERRDANE